MFCTNCGAQIDDGSAFCTECGAPTSEVTADKTAVISEQDVNMDAAFEPSTGPDAAASSGAAFATGAAAGATTVLGQGAPAATDRQFAPRDQVATSPVPAQAAQAAAPGGSFDRLSTTFQPATTFALAYCRAVCYSAILAGWMCPLGTPVEKRSPAPRVATQAAAPGGSFDPPPTAFQPATLSL